MIVRLRPPGVSAVRANAGADSGGLKRPLRSFGEGGRTGRLSALFPVVSVSVTGSGEGQMSGQYVVETRDADAVSFGERVRGIDERDAHVERPAARQPLHFVGAVAMREIERRVRDARRGAVGRDVAQPHADERDRPVDRQREVDRRACRESRDPFSAARCRSRAMRRRPRAGRPAARGSAPCWNHGISSPPARPSVCGDFHDDLARPPARAPSAPSGVRERSAAS